MLTSEEMQRVLPLGTGQAALPRAGDAAAFALSMVFHATALFALGTLVLVMPPAPLPVSQQPLEVDFRVLSDGGKFVVIDFSVAGIWLAIEERDQFSSFLGQNGGNIQTLQVTVGERG